MEQEEQENTVYDEWRDLISVDEEGTDKEEVLSEDMQMARVADYFRASKIASVEESASRFNLRSDQLADLIVKMQNTKPPLLDGLFDRETGNFLYIPLEERRKLAEVIKSAGRISTTELLWEANRLFDFSPASTT